MITEIQKFPRNVNFLEILTLCKEEIKWTFASLPTYYQISSCHRIDIKESDVLSYQKTHCYFAEKRKQKVYAFDILQMIYSSVSNISNQW